MTDIVADIGGTNARFALARQGQISAPVQLLCADFPGIEQALETVFTQLTPEHPPTRLSLAVAGTVADDEVMISNNHWRFSKYQLKSRFGLDALTVINDFTAQALGVTCYLKGDGLFTMDKATMNKATINKATMDEATMDGNSPHIQLLREGTADTDTPIAVLGPGTGLGFSALIPAQGYMVPLETEGGQVGLAAQTKEEESLLAAIRSGQRHDRLVAEDILSGRGLVTLYNHLGDNKLDTEQAAMLQILAENGEVQANKAIIHFLNFLGNYIASAILHLGAKQAVYICGGITPRLQKFLPQSAFFDRITHHDRFSDFIADVPVYLVQDNASGLRGSAVALDNPACAHRRI